jgi:cyclic pyranopterin phosphate synthase
MTLPLTDSFGRALKALRISVTDRCNFRCSYCMPEKQCGHRYVFAPRSEILTFEEIVRLAQLLVDLGVTKLRLTGGEPLLRKHIERLIEHLASQSGITDLALTTNGSLLSHKARSLKDAGLHRLTVSLNSLDNDTVMRMNSRNYSVLTVLNGIESAEKTGFSPIKINAVIIRGVNDHTVLDLAQHFRHTGHIVRFIEYMDAGTMNRWNWKHLVPIDEMISLIHSVYPLEREFPLYFGEVAQRYRYQDGAGEIGFIGAVTQPFCSQCTRLRLSPDGKLYTCLFTGHGLDIRTALRNNTQDTILKKLITMLWQNRNDQYSVIRRTPLNIHRTARKIEMYQIGG